MTKRAIARCLAISAALLAACGPGVQQGNQNNSDGGSSQPVFQMPCDTNRPCPSGQFCFNGLCALGCNSNNECAADQYCDLSTFGDRLCHNKTVTNCPAVACASSQICVAGMCSTPAPATQCDPGRAASGQDGCDSHAICIDPDLNNQPKCYTFAACPQDGNCPIGSEGAVCNDGIVPNKARICLTGLCKTAANCPSAWGCVRYLQNDVVGVCSNGANFTLCNSSSNCLTPNKCVKGNAADYSGFCSNGTPGSFCGQNTDCQSNFCMTNPFGLGMCQ